MRGRTSLTQRACSTRRRASYPKPVREQGLGQVGAGRWADAFAVAEGAFSADCPERLSLGRRMHHADD